jgi:hypothetical protein
MPEPISIPLSEYQQKKFAAIRAENQRLQDKFNTSVTTIVEGLYDPEQFASWTIDTQATQIVLTPPAPDPVA